MERQNVESSLATSVGYEPATSTLEIEFKSNGAVWQYYDVPESVYNEMMNGSIGKYFLANIKGQYVESQVG
ncbi:MAG: KTSC domain-containing protein [Bacteroidetes bacterium]|nr:KTSC domain-containing protein [Bacteroidota bacterium]